ncbi:hypothetical protein HDU76_009708 [Blyttiomyces sp. JEL0837]|nr:hypothetical protein HDU76_009708 [Blyttiomyces sp. JEL0837]
MQASSQNLITADPPIHSPSSSINDHGMDRRSAVKSRSAAFSALRIEPTPLSAVSRNAYSGTMDGIIKIYSREGITSLWRGLSPTLIMQVPSTVIYYIGYEKIRDGLKANFKFADSSPYAPLLSGALARSCVAVLISPLELIRTRMQSGGPESGLVSVTRQVVGMMRECGVTSLWRGLGSTLWRDVPFSAIYWSGYESLKRVMAANNTFAKSKSEFWPSFIAGATAGTVAAIATTPFDVAKTLQQVIHHDEPGMESSTLYKTPEYAERDADDLC